MTKPARDRPDAEQTRARVAELHAAGITTRNGIARELGCSPSTVSKHAAALGIKFDRSATKAATQAKTADLASRRAALVDRMMTTAEVGLDQIEKGTIQLAAITQSGKVVKTTREVDMTDRRNAITIAGIAVDKATKLLDRDTGVEGAESTLDAIEKVIGAAALGLIDGDQTQG